ncbi:MAG: hypothetical protein L0L60_04985 [Tetragenococcus halophilus]|nr:hypothetical protein [Staphylococcus equorum]MDN6839830.1 hypothetical protein [Tetragenococcus halophilus]
MVIPTLIHMFSPTVQKILFFLMPQSANHGLSGTAEAVEEELSLALFYYCFG